jgi:hypothetical protein
MSKGDKRIAYRDSKTGEFISKQQAQRKNPATWERQHVPKPGKGKYSQELQTTSGAAASPMFMLCGSRAPTQ